MKVKYQSMYTESHKKDMDYVMVGDFYIGPFIDRESACKASMNIDEAINSTKPKPTRTVYEKAELTLSEKIETLKRGDWLYTSEDGRIHIDWGLAKTWKLDCLDNKVVYLRVEKPVSWQDECYDYFRKTPWLHESDDLSDVMSKDWNKDSQEAFLEMCRVALRANGEIE